MISFRTRGNYKKVTRFLERAKESIHIGLLNKYGRAGVEALRAATPKDSGLTSESWRYEIENQNGQAKLIFLNSNIHDGVPIAIILQYGHATGTGGWVQGIDYINPAIRPVFEKLAEEAWEEVTRE